MTLDITKVRAAVTGAVSVDLGGTATAPTGTATALTDYADLGLVTTDGVSLQMPDAPDKQSIKAWQNGQSVRTLRTPPDDVPQLSFALLETKLETIEYAFNAEVTQTSTEGSFVINSNNLATPVPLVLDVIDGSELIRGYAPKATLSALGEVKLVSTDAIAYAVTVDLELDADIAGQMKVWMTALKSVV